MKRLVLAILAGLSAFGLVFGLAASLTVNSAKLAAGSTTVSGCDADGTVSVAFGLLSTDLALIDSVSLGGLDVVNCLGSTVHTQLLAVDGSVLRSVSCTLGTDCTGALNVTDVAIALVDKVSVTIAA